MTNKRFKILEKTLNNILNRKYGDRYRLDLISALYHDMHINFDEIKLFLKEKDKREAV